MTEPSLSRFCLARTGIFVRARVRMYARARASERNVHRRVPVDPVWPCLFRLSSRGCEHVRLVETNAQCE